MALFDMILLGSSFQFTNSSFQFTYNGHPSNPFRESAEPYYLDIKTNYTGPNYFFPSATLAFAVANEYSDEIKEFHFFISFDNSSWVEIPLTKPLHIIPDPFPELNYTLTYVGRLPLNGFSNEFYAKCVFPPQGLNDTANARIMDAFGAYMLVSPLWTPQSTATVVLVSVALLSFIIQILDFCFKERS